ncbi:two-component regulator propeller domain-containing protein [Novosphingobium sp. FKTRR1]|uniref:ligand-binding sensor domain-containing protein n=1 Tax=Novosphingobium sp. FKTRR1 TaxID=2879118 RepID=UPI001CF01C32|nr:sensor histidine kinase [Novosphingobium sp. FKTRR1]
MKRSPIRLPADLNSVASRREPSRVRRAMLVVVCLFGLLLAPPALSLDPTRSIAQFHHTSWTIADGMPANIWAITQTPDGYLWLGSVNGLYRFDGVRVERIAAEKLPSPSIHALAATASGGLWIGYERPVGVISYLHDGEVTNYRINSRNSTSVHAFAVGPDKTVWASTPDNILRFDGKQWVIVQGSFGFSFSEGSGGVWSFGVARDGVVWSKNLGGMFYLKPGQQRFERAAGYVGGPEGFTTTPDGRLWTTDTRAAHLYPMPDLARVRTTGPPSANPGLVLPKAIEGPILLDRDGTLWCSSVGGGGLRRVRTVLGATMLDQGADSHGPSVATNGLSSDLVHTLFEDREGNIWIGTSLGLDRFRPANIVTETLVPAGFRARFVGAAGKQIFAYTGWSGTASRAVDGTQALYRIRPGQDPERYVANVGRLRGMFTGNRDGSVWLITQDGIQQLLGRKLAAPVALPDEVEGKAVYSAAYDARGTLWISTFVHGVFSRSQNAWRRFPLESKVGATGVLIPDPDGSMWIRYSGGGLFRVKDGKTDDFSHNGLNIGDVTFIQPQGSGVVIGGENGVGSFKGGAFHALRAANVPALSGVTGIANTADGSTWIFTQAGILRARTSSFENALAHSDPKRLQFELMDSRDGLPGAPYGAVYGSSVAADATGRVWFTTGNGLVWIDPNNLFHNPLAPNVVIDSLTADERRYPARPDLRLAAGTSNIEIEFTALSLSIPERVRFRYKLEGIDPDWVDAGNRRQAFYTRLGPGTYSFHVIAANSDGVWNTRGATFTFVIAPTFVQSRLFMALCALAVGLLLWLAYSLRLAQLSARLRTQHEARLSERERIARELHDTLLQGFQGLMLLFQSVADTIPDDQPAREKLESAMKRGDDALIEGRNRVQDLRSIELGEDLVKMLHAIALHIAQSDGFSVRILTRGEARAVNPEIAEELAKIGAEAIRNAVRHAQGTLIDVTVVYAATHLHLLIEDDGVGIAEHVLAMGRRDGHFGLVGMRERSSTIGARFTLGRRTPSGTIVEIVVPGAIAYPDAAIPRWYCRIWQRLCFDRLRIGKPFGQDKRRARNPPY